MKQDFSHQWKTSKNRKKQRKYIANAPMHIKGKFVSSNLSKTLRQKYNIRSLRIRKGDKAKVMRGQHKGKSGIVDSVDIKNRQITLDSIASEKRDGSKSHIPIHPSNLQIQEFNIDDNKRKKKIEAKMKKETKK